LAVVGVASEEVPGEQDGAGVAAAAPPGAAAGRIPFVLRIGVTGHRRLADPAAVAGLVDQGLLAIRDRLRLGGSTELVFVVLSALAEGADRLVASRTLAFPGSRLEVVLPCQEAEYLEDFGTAESRQEFRQLIRRASHVRHAPRQPNREQGYEWAGRHLADRCDVLVAVWDGQPGHGRGGTQEVVAYARDHGVPLIWIRTGDRAALVTEFGGEAFGRLLDAARDLGAFNAARIPDDVFAAELDRNLGYLGLAGEQPDGGPTDTTDELFLRRRMDLAAWLLPFFVRADVQALRLQGGFRFLSTAMFAMAALAVTVVAIQVNLFPGANWVAGFEILLLLLLLSIPFARNKLRLHERWTSCRFLAERLRSAYFLSLAGTTDRGRRDGEVAFADPSVAWIERALAEIMAGRPRARFSQAEVAPLRSYLSRYWIGDQVSYHVKATGRHERWEIRLRRATAALFFVTLVAAVLHLAGVGDHGLHRSTLAATLIVLSICIPAVGAAVHGAETQGQYKRHAQRFDRMAALLARLRQRMDAAEDLRQVQVVAAEVERTMREESNDWFGVMRFHDVELIT